MRQPIFLAIRLLFGLTILTGIIYPFSITLISQVAFPSQAHGSLVTVDGMIVGSALIGQEQDDARYFWSRPSAVNTMLDSSPDLLSSSGATNFSPTNELLARAVKEREEAFRIAHSITPAVPVPVEMVFASGSGLDPHISPEAARLQIDRVAATRNLARDRIALLVEQYIELPTLGILGQPRVNVLLLNIALDQLQ